MAGQEMSKSETWGLWEDVKVKEGTEKPEKQQHDPAGLGDSDQLRKVDGPAMSPAMSSATNPNEFQSMMNMNSSLNNGMDYNQMMQLMSGNMGSGIANFNPMMGMSKMVLHDLNVSDTFQVCQIWGWVQCRGCSGIWVAPE
jgi:hypothetical protein